MLSKKIIYLCSAMSVLVLAPLYAATPMETLTKVKEGLMGGQEQVAKAVIKLTGVYSGNQAGVLNKLQSAHDDLNSTVSLLKTVDEYSRWVMVGLAAVVAGGSAAGAALGAVTLGVGAVAMGIVVAACAVAIPLLVDVPEIVSGLLGTLSSIQSLLRTVKGNIEPKNDLLKPGSARITSWFENRTRAIQARITKAVAAAQTTTPTSAADLAGIKDAITDLGGLLKAAKGLNKETIKGIDATFDAIRAANADPASLQNSLNMAINQFNAIKATITPEEGDSRGVYRHLEASYTKFGEAVATADKLISGLQKTAAAIRGKTTTPTKRKMIEEEPEEEPEAEQEQKVEAEEKKEE